MKSLEKPTVKELDLDYSEDFPVICANAAFLVSEAICCGTLGESQESKQNY